MKKEFTRLELLESEYINDKQVEGLQFTGGKITLTKLFEALPIADFCKLLIRECLSKEQAQQLALASAEEGVSYWKKEYPKDTTVEHCIKTTKVFLEGGVSRMELIDAADAAYSWAAAYTAYAAADAADWADDVADVATDWAADAAYVADDPNFQQFVKQWLDTNLKGWDLK